MDSLKINNNAKSCKYQDAETRRNAAETTYSGLHENFCFTNGVTGLLSKGITRGIIEKLW
jgi:hypothetical protein